MADLNYKLRLYSAKYVKINREQLTEAKEIVRDYITDGHVYPFIKEHSKIPVRHVQHTGSVYERLKTQAADEVDIMIVMQTKKDFCIRESHEPGYSRLQLTRQDHRINYGGFLTEEGFLKVDKLLSHLESLVDRAVNNYEGENSSDRIKLSRPIKHGPAVQLDVYRRSTGRRLMSVDLVMSFEVGGKYFVTKMFKSTTYHDRTTLLRQSFSLVEKSLLQNMDDEDECRHELLRIVKTIVTNDNSQLSGNLSSYHLKTAFLRYDTTYDLDWSTHQLGERFLGFLQFLVAFLRQKNLPHYFIPEVNLLEDVGYVVVDQMAYRLQRLINSEQERNKVLDGESIGLRITTGVREVQQTAEVIQDVIDAGRQANCIIQ